MIVGDDEFSRWGELMTGRGGEGIISDRLEEGDGEAIEDTLDGGEGKTIADKLGVGDGEMIADTLGDTKKGGADTPKGPRSSELLGDEELGGVESRESPIFVATSSRKSSSKPSD